MENSQPNSKPVFMLVSISIILVVAVLALPDIFVDVLKITGWAAVGLTGFIALFLHISNKKKEKIIKDQALEDSLRRRKAQREKEAIEREKRLEKAQKITKKKEAAHEAKQDKIKNQMIEEAEVTWESREKRAQQEEERMRQIISETYDMVIRTVAGYIATEWNEASILSKWTAEQLIMFSRRPNVTTKAREEEREAILEAEEIKASGNTLTEKQGYELKQKKKKAREEVKMEEARLKSIQDVIDNADIKWRGIEMRVNRRQKELDLLLDKQSARR